MFAMRHAQDVHSMKERNMKQTMPTLYATIFVATCVLNAPCEMMRSCFAAAPIAPAPTSQATTVTGTQTAKPMSSPSGMRSPDRKRPVRKGSMTRTVAREIAPAATTATDATTVPATGGAAGNTSGNAPAPVTAESAAAALESALH